MTIYVFGNPLLDFDNLPLQLIPQLKNKFPQINFVAMDPNENLKPLKKKLVIIDTAAGIDKVTVINDLNRIKLDKIYSPHDFDLGFYLKLLQKIGQLKKIIIFAVPSQIKKNDALEQLSQLINSAGFNGSTKPY